jgi:predicted amidophosphoribosyltransferase
MNERSSNPMPNSEDDLQAEYRFDYQKATLNRFATRHQAENLKAVVLDDDVVQVFTTFESVNKALRAFIEAVP